MTSLINEIGHFIKNFGALKVGVVAKESIAGGPPSANITYNLPDAQSALIFALPMDREKIRAFLRKDEPHGRADHDKNNMETILQAYIVADKAAKLLEEQGYEAKPIYPNFKYREDKLSSVLYSHPEISLRYLAVRSGVGSFGWSGNVGIKDFGTAFMLGGLTTTAKLVPTEPIPLEESFCSKCKLCTKVCAFRMFSQKEEVSVTLGGHKFSYSKRNDINRCSLVCGGYSGLDKDKKFSTWAPARYDYPETPEDVVKTFTQAYRIKPDLRCKDEHFGFNRDFIEENKEIKDFLANSKSVNYLVKTIKYNCGHCQLICRGNIKETRENYDLLINSGFVVRNTDGSTSVIRSKDADAAKKFHHPQKRKLKDRIASLSVKRAISKQRNNKQI